MNKFSRDTGFTWTKIVGTLGPASADRETLKQLILSGLDVVRLNCSHSNPKELSVFIDLIRMVEEETENPVAILADLGGPKIRLAAIPEDIPVKTGEKIILTSDISYTGSEKIPAGYPELAEDVKPGNKILIDDGLIQLEVISVTPPDIECVVLNNGILKSRKGINLPGVKISIPTLTEKDLNDLKFLLTQSIDFIALSFVRSAEDIKELKNIIHNAGRNIPVIAKIEKPEAVDNLEEILEATDAVMVARGDLGVEMPTEQLPVIQKHIISECNKKDIPVITATQMLDSMIINPRPTRAEASDVANAVFDGTDAVMLSGETSVGKYPVESVKTMDKIVRIAEQHITISKNTLQYNSGEITSAEKAVCHSASMLAEEENAAALISITRSGRTPLLLSRFRTHVPIIAFTERIEVVRFLNIVWGVQAELIDRFKDTDTTLKAAGEKARKLGYLKSGDTAVFTGGTPLNEETPTNTIIIYKLN